MLFYDGGPQWKKAQGPRTQSSHTKISVFLDKETIFVTKQSGGGQSEVYSASVIAALSEDTDTRSSVWSTWSIYFKPQSEPYSKRGIGFLSNITTLGDHLMILDAHVQPIRLFRFVPQTDTSPCLWEELDQLQLPDWRYNTYLSIVGLSDRKLLIIYMGRTDTVQGPKNQLKMLVKGDTKALMYLSL